MTKTFNTNQNKLLSQMKPANSDKICRACLSPLTAVTGYYLFDAQQLAIKFASCCSNLAKLDENDNLPKMLCIKCKNKIFSFYSFQVMCLASDKYLRELNCVVATPTESLLELSGNTEKKYKNDITTVNISSPDKSQDVHEAPSISNTTKVKRSERLREKPRSIKINMQDHTMEYIANEHIKCETNSTEEDISVLDDEYKIGCSLKTFSACETNTPTKYEADEDENVSQSDPLYQEDGIELQYEDTTNINSKMPIDTYKCELWSLQFSNEKSLITHQSQHNEKQQPVTYFCTHDGCNKKFKKKDMLTRHEKEKHSGMHTVYACTQPGCEKVYLKKHGLDIHMRNIHKIETEIEAHICEICGKSFKRSFTLNVHRYTHLDKSKLPFVCKEPGCELRFSNSSNYNVHMLRHAGIKKYQCSICGERKTSSTELKIHVNYHTKELTFPCRICNKICYSSSQRKNHERTVHERARNYKCRYCELAFNRPKTLKFHEMRHTGEKPYQCGECGRHFRQPDALRTHSKIHKRENAKVKIKTKEPDECEEFMDIEELIECDEFTEYEVLDDLNE